MRAPAKSLPMTRTTFWVAHGIAVVDDDAADVVAGRRRQVGYVRGDGDAGAGHVVVTQPGVVVDVLAGGKVAHSIGAS